MQKKKKKNLSGSMDAVVHATTASFSVLLQTQ